VVTTRTTHDDLLLPRGSFAPQLRKSSHSGLFGYPGPPLLLEIGLSVNSDGDSIGFINQSGPNPSNEVVPTPPPAPPTEQEPWPPPVGTIDFDGSGESYGCQRSRLWYSTVVSSAIVFTGWGAFLAFSKGTKACTAVFGGLSVNAINQILTAKRALQTMGC
jgi:hypothetical protein